MNTIASTFRSSPPLTSPRLTRAASAQQPVDLAPDSSPRARGSRAWSRQHLLEAGEQQVGLAPARTRAAAAAGAPAGSVAVPVRMRCAEQRPLHLGRRAAEVQPQQQPAAAAPGCTPSAARAAREMLADLDGVGDEPLALDHVDVGERRGAGHRPAAEGAAEIAERERAR